MNFHHLVTFDVPATTCATVTTQATAEPADYCFWVVALFLPAAAASLQQTLPAATGLR
jgi:hypothetical protein